MILETLIIICGITLLTINNNRYLHILQQSFYNISEFIPVIKKNKSINIGKFEVLLIILSILYITIPYSTIILIIYLLVLCLNMISIIKNKPKVKKKFVITNRVKITYVAVILLSILIIIIPYIYFNFNEKNIIMLYAIFILLSLNKYLSMIIVSISNIMVKPILKLLNLRYINDAKNIIKNHKNLKVVGITGSYGKTSTKNIVSSILSEKFNTVMTPKSFNTTLGVVKSIRENIKSYTEVFVCEMGAARLRRNKRNM